MKIWHLYIDGTGHTSTSGMFIGREEDPAGEWVKAEDAEKLKEENKLLREREGRLIAVLDKLARLGNGTKFGNSIGNTIALDALRAEFPETYRL